jgi:hypothetical protein
MFMHLTEVQRVRMRGAVGERKDWHGGGATGGVGGGGGEGDVRDRDGGAGARVPVPAGVTMLETC